MTTQRELHNQTIRDYIRALIHLRRHDAPWNEILYADDTADIIADEIFDMLSSELTDYSEVHDLREQLSTLQEWLEEANETIDTLESEVRHWHETVRIVEAHLASIHDEVKQWE